MVEDLYVEELAQEQTHFDKARAAYDASLLLEDPKNWAVGTGPERRAMKQTLESKEHLGANDPVAFGRMDLDDGESYLVGKVTVADANSDRLVVSWKSRMAERFYQATTKNPLGVVRKRDFRTTGNHVDAFADKVFAHLAKQVESLEDELRADDALLHSLAASRTGQMQDIVRTIQASQDKIMRAAKDQLLIVQGGPGTGKTAVALHRASWLLYTYRDELPADDLLVVGPNPAFTKYIQQVLPGLGDQRVQQTSVQELLAGGRLQVRGHEPTNVARVKGMAEMADVIARGLDDRIKVPLSPLRISRRYSAVPVTIQPATVAPDIQQLRSEPYGKGREALKARLLEHCATIGGLRAGQSIADVMDPTSVDAAVDRMWPRLSPPQFIRELLGSKQRLRSAAADYLTADQIELLYRGTADRISDEPWTLADLALIDEAEEYMSEQQTLWGHIVVDEAQDLTPMQLFALRRRTRHGSMTLVGDVAQSTGPFARENWDDVVEALKTRLPATVEELRHGYRVPKEVFDVAAKLLPVAAPGITAPTIVRSANADPELFDVVRGQLAREVAKVASHHSSKGRFVGVVAPKELWEEVQGAFTDAELKWSDSSEGQLGSSINLVTPEASKGLEFDAVVVVDPQAIFDQDNGARLLYIALTRTTSRLDVIAPAGEIPQIIRDGFPKVTVIDEPVPPVTGPAPQAAPVPGVKDPEIAESVTDVGEETPNTGRSVSQPTDPAVTPRSIKSVMGKTLSTFTREAAPKEDAPAATHLSAVERELVSRNADYLFDIILKMYGPEIRRAIVEETLRRVVDAESAGEADGTALGLLPFADNDVIGGK